MRQALELRPVRSLIETALRQVGERTGIPFAVRFAEGGEQRTAGQPPAFKLVFRDARAYWLIAAFGHIGLLEAYFDGELDIEGSLARAMAAGMEGGMDRPKPLVRVRNWWHELRFSNASWRQARTNADFHYALGPEFYRLWLDDPLMMYTCAYWKEGTRTLEEAQRNKIDHVARKLLLAPGEEVVDIGAGFGGFMFHAHERFGVRVTGVNTTASQADMVRGEIERRRLGGTLQVLSDFRDARRVGGALRSQLGADPRARSAALRRALPPRVARLPVRLRRDVPLAQGAHAPVPDRVLQGQRHAGQLSDEPGIPLRTACIPRKEKP